MMTRDKNIRMLVSGASIAGLTTAFWLVRSGFEVTVVERAPHLRPGGQALDVRGPGLEVAERMGVLATIRERRTKLRGISMVDSTGKEIYRNTERTFTGGRHNSADVEIMRDDLCRILYEAVDDKVEYIFDDSIASLTQDESGIDVTFETHAPRRFDLVIGADGLHSKVRRIAFGPEEQFFRDLGMGYISTFGMPNIFDLERWETFYFAGDIGLVIMALDKDADVRAYLGFNPHKVIDYDYRDIDAQKRLLADNVVHAGWMIPQVVEHMMHATDFHFDSPGQIRMGSWSHGRVMVVGDAGYSISPATGQGTTVAMVGAYVLAGELATHKEDLAAGIIAYEDELRDYVIRNQDSALNDRPDIDVAALSDDLPETEDAAPIDGLPDLGQLVQPLILKSYPSE